MPADMAPLSDPVAEHRFACALCDREAGRVELFGPADAGVIIRDSFTSRLTLRVTPGGFGRVAGIVVDGNIRALHEFNLEVASFYCPRCNACYCGEHWAQWDVFEDDAGFIWHDSVRGRCPRGHERMLED